jgi:DNA-binding NtrC family response regulator
MKSSEFKVLVVDDDFNYAETCARVIVSAGFHASAVGSASGALACLQAEGDIRLVLTDLKMPRIDGLQFLREIKTRHGDVDVIVMTGYGSIESAVQAIKEKATDYITKPFDRDELINAIQKVYKVWKLEHEVQRLRRALGEKLDVGGFVFKSALTQDVYDRVLSAAGCDCTVLITGESGTGKELLAKAIHKNSRRCAGPFIAVNCGALPTDLMESELFGYKKGAFTGADRDYAGLFMAAHGGTLFLDEIVEMRPETQTKLLRSIQERAIRAIGSVEETRVNARFIAATNADVKAALARKQLREDLFYRLNVIPIAVPPLRNLRDEIPDLIRFLLAKGNRQHAHQIEGVDDHAMDLLVHYPWPGNIRELENVVEGFFSVSKQRMITVRDLPAQILAERNVASSPEPVPSFLEAERDLILRALREAKGNKSKAAEILGISRPRLYKKMERYQIDEAQV